MERRRVLAGCGAAIAGLLAGCPADTGPGQQSPTAGPAETTGTAPADESTASATRTPPPTPTPTPRPTATPPATPTPTPVPDAETRRTALAAYRAGFEEREAYDRSTQVARVGFDREKYQGAEVRYRDALERAEAAAARFEQAGDLAARAGVPEARRIADEAATHTRRYLIPFAQRGIDAARAAEEGRLEAADERIAEMRELTEAARSSSTNTTFPAGFRFALEL